MSAHEHVNPVQFQHTHIGGSGHWGDDGEWVPAPASQGRHIIHATDSNDEQVGSLTWQRGEIQHIAVHPDYRRQGIATQMFERANEITPGIRHSPNRTDDGEAWSATVSGDRPERRK